MPAAIGLLFALTFVPPQHALTVSAAVSLTEALNEIAEAFQRAAGVRISTNLAASNVLARQIVRGAPVDVFISADDAQMDVVERAGFVVPGTRVPVVGNRLAVVVRAGGPSPESVQDLTRQEIRRIATGDPAAVPAGAYAKAYFERVYLWERLQPKLVPTTSVRAAVTAVLNGSVDAGVVYATDARAFPALRVALTIAGPDSPQIVYPAAVIKGSRDPALARRFVEFLGAPEAQAIFARHGFGPAPAGP